MKIIPSCAAILFAAVRLVSAAPTITLNQPTYVGASAGETQSFTENTSVSFDHTVSSMETSNIGWIYSATAGGELQISLDGLQLSGSSSGSVSVDGSYIPALAGSYGALFEIWITIPTEDPSYSFAFAGTTSATATSFSTLMMFEQYYSGTPLFHFGANIPGVSGFGGVVTGVLEPGKSYLFYGENRAQHGGGASEETSDFFFNLQMTPQATATSPLEAVLPPLANGQLEAPTLELPAGLPPRFSFRRLDSSLTTHDLTVEWSTNPTDPNAWNPIPIPLSSQGDITIIDHGGEPDEVQVSIPAAVNQPRAFCRLKVEETAIP